MRPPDVQHLLGPITLIKKQFKNCQRCLKFSSNTSSLLGNRPSPTAAAHKLLQLVHQDCSGWLRKTAREGQCVITETECASSRAVRASLQYLLLCLPVVRKPKAQRGCSKMDV